MSTPDRQAALARLLAPMAVFTADEAWEFLPGASTASVHMVGLPKSSGTAGSQSYALLMRLRDEALLALDRLKKEQGLNKATDAEIRYRLTSADRRVKGDLVPFRAVSHRSARRSFGLEKSLKVVTQSGRCWECPHHIQGETGTDPPMAISPTDHPDLVTAAWARAQPSPRHRRNRSFSP